MLCSLVDGSKAGSARLWAELEVDVSHQLLVQVELLLNERRKLPRVAAGRLDPLHVQPGDHLGARHGLLHRAAQRGDDLRRCAGRRHQSEPADSLVARQPRLAHGRYVGKQGRTGLAADGEGPQRARLDERHHAGDRPEIELRFVGHGRGHRRRAAFVGHMDRLVLDAGERNEHGDGEMAGRAGAARGVVELARLRLRERDQL